MSKYSQSKPVSKVRILILALVAGFFISSCSKVSESVDNSLRIVEFDGFVMGTSYHVKVVTRLKDPGQLTLLEKGVQSSLDRVDGLMSTYKSSSELSQFNNFKMNSWFKFSKDTFTVIEEALKLSADSKGLYDISVGPLVNLWGFGPDKRPTKVPKAEQLKGIIESNIGYQSIVLDRKVLSVKKLKPVYLDLSSIAKGYAVDKVAEFLVDKSVKSFLVEVGGEVKALGVKPNGKAWHLAIEAPSYDQRSVYSIIELSGHGLATSGDYRNYYEQGGKRFSHTINPLTGYPVQHKLASASVVAPTTAQADALATAFMVMGTEQAYNFAVKRHIAAFFIYREKGQFLNRLTPDFKKFIIEKR